MQNIGKEFIKETTKLINKWILNSPTRHICLKAMMVRPSLLLMRTSKQSKTAENKKHLARRPQLRKDHNIKDLLLEFVTINNRKYSNVGTINEVVLSRKLSKLTMEGKINPALRLLEQGAFSKILALTYETMQCLRQKHPNVSLIYEDKLLQRPIKFISPAIYDNINAALIRKCAVRTNGASGP